MRCVASFLLLCVLLVLPCLSRAGSESGNDCGAPADFVTTDASLAQFGAAIAGGGPVDILAVGSATTVGSVTTTGEQSASRGGAFPWHMVHELHAALPRVEFRLTVRGGRGMTAEDMLPLIE